MYIPTIQEISIYAAGKTWCGKEFRNLRDIHGFNINSRWIDLEQLLDNPNSIHLESVHNDHNYLSNLWDYGCKEDCISCDMMVLYCTPEDGEKQSGALVELGSVSVLGKPVYIIGTCASVEPAGHSDRAWKFQKNVYHWPEITDSVKGFMKAVIHYRFNYAAQWNFNRYERSA